MVVPAHRALKSLEKGAHGVLLAQITASLRIEDVVLKVEVLFDDLEPDHSMAMAYSSKIHTDIACEDITSITPQTPVVVGSFFVAETARHSCRTRRFAQSVSV